MSSFRVSFHTPKLRRSKFFRGEVGYRLQKYYMQETNFLRYLCGRCAFNVVVFQLLVAIPCRNYINRVGRRIELLHDMFPHLLPL